MKAIILSFVFIGLGFTTYAQIGIGTTSPAATAALDIESTTKGLLIPRLTQTQRDAIQSPASGLMIFCTNCAAQGQPQFYNGTSWNSMLKSASLLNGTSDPGANTGANDDFFINTTSNQLFGPKASGSWPAGISMVGPSGTNGTNGILSSGSAAGNTPYWNGTNWVVSSSNIYNNGTNVGIGTSSPTVKFDVTGAGRFITTTLPLTLTSTNNTVYQAFKFNSTTDVGQIGNGTGVIAGGNQSDFGIWAPAGNLLFATSTGLERMRITSTGNVGIGTTAPQKKFHVVGDVVVDGTFYIGTNSNPFSGNAPKFVILAPNGSDALNFKHLSNGSNAINIWQTGTSDFTALALFKGDTQDYKGGIRVTTSGVSYSSTSDYRLKENVVPLKDGLSRLMQLKPVQYNWKINNTKDEGFLAHELQSVFPYAVSGYKDEVDDKGNIKPQAVDYGRITPLLVKAIQELQTTVEELKAKIKVLEEKK